ncbi:MAG: DUF4085 family protein [Thermoanaerobaculia bacterium]
MQPGSGVPFRTAQRRWKAACSALAAHLKSIRPALPASMRRFSDTTLHDGVIRSARRPARGRVVLEIDGSNCPWGPVGQFRLTFKGVRDVRGLDRMRNDEWLYEEVDLHKDAKFEYRVLLFRSEFRIAADEVKFEKLRSRRI